MLLLSLEGETSSLPSFTMSNAGARTFPPCTALVPARWYGISGGSPVDPVTLIRRLIRSLSTRPQSEPDDNVVIAPASVISNLRYTLHGLPKPLANVAQHCGHCVPRQAVNPNFPAGFC